MAHIIFRNPKFKFFFHEHITLIFIFLILVIDFSWILLDWINIVLKQSFRRIFINKTALKQIINIDIERTVYTYD